MALRKMPVKFSELAFVGLECQICAALAKVQPAQPPLQMSSAFPVMNELFACKGSAYNPTS